jgi:aspartyl-tRNA(Asn)/glutamyl-tRNA(Gln) amidotransferase subunit C
MALTPEDVQHIGRLARVGLTDEDVTKFATQLSGIIDHFEALAAVPTDDVAPTAHAAALSNVMREDAVRPSLSRDDVVANAPEEEEGHLRVRAVLE